MTRRSRSRATTEALRAHQRQGFPEIKSTIDGLVDAATGGKILIDARSNALVVTERPSRIGRINNIIAQSSTSPLDQCDD